MLIERLNSFKKEFPATIFKKIDDIRSNITETENKLDPHNK
jgi:hypothetical protein